MNNVFQKKLQVNTSFVINSLRNCGYTNYSAIADILDNSLEQDVCSKNVSVKLETTGKGESKSLCAILIVDDGNGMDVETLTEAMSLGSNTGKDGETCLGLYGTGMKSASLSIGKKLEVFTKTRDGQLNVATLNIDNVDIFEDIMVSINRATDEQKSYFDNLVNNESGTIVKISNLDRLTNTNVYIFKNTLKRKIGEWFNKFIDAKKFNFFVDDDRVEMIDLIGDKIGIPVERLSEKDAFFMLDGKEIRYNAWYIKSTGNDNNDVKNTIKRGQSTSGLYIYRQNRLVGQALNLGVMSGGITKDSYHNSFRCEIFIDGTCDYFFNSTFTKTISEKDKESLYQPFKDALDKNIKPLVGIAKQRDIDAKTDDKMSDDTKKMYESLKTRQDKNPMLSVDRKGGQNKTSEVQKTNNLNPKKQENPNPYKKRKETWCDFDERALGRDENIYRTDVDERGKAIIIVNTSHTFYQNFYKNLPTEYKYVIAQLFSCDFISKQNCNYFGNEDVEKIIDKYNEVVSTEMAKSMDF